MPTNPSTPRASRSPKILWKWTAVSAALHVLFIAALCAFSYVTWQHKQAKAAAKAAVQEAATAKAEAERAAKAAAQEAAAAKAEAERAAKAPASPPPTRTPAPATNAAASEPAPAQAEKILGIDKVAKPEEIPKSPFASGESDLLKDLK